MRSTTATTIKRLGPVFVAPTDHQSSPSSRIRSGRRLSSPRDLETADLGLLPSGLVMLMILLVVWLCLYLGPRCIQRLRAYSLILQQRQQEQAYIEQWRQQQQQQSRQHQDEQEVEQPQRRRLDVVGSGSDTNRGRQSLNVEVEMTMAKLRRTMYLTNFRQEAVVTVRTWKDCMDCLRPTHRP
jgi:hypothetical protein